MNQQPTNVIEVEEFQEFKELETTLVQDLLFRIEDTMARHLEFAGVDLEVLANEAGEITLNDLLRGAMEMPAENREALAVELLAINPFADDDYGADWANLLDTSAVDGADDEFDLIAAEASLALAMAEEEGDEAAAADGGAGEDDAEARRERVAAFMDGVTEEADDDEEEGVGDFDDPLSHIPYDMGVAVMNGYVTPPDLAWDGDIDRLIARQTELMNARYDGIGEETQDHKRQGLAIQQLQVEQSMALRIALGFDDLDKLTAHLKRCLDDADFGYGTKSDRGDNGRVLAQSLVAVADVEGIDFDAVVALWFEASLGLYHQARAGLPILVRPPYDDSDLDFLPVLTLLSENRWRLGDPEHGKSREFDGPILEVWGKIVDTLTEWMDADSGAWLTEVRRKAERLPADFAVAAWSEVLTKDVYSLVAEGETRFVLHRKRSKSSEVAPWPRSLTIADQVGLTRLSGHGLYEVAWDHGQQVRKFDINSTQRLGLPVEHIEIATNIARALVVDGDFPPADFPAIELAYLRRMKATAIELSGPPETSPFPDYPAVAGYTIETRKGPAITVVLFGHREALAFVADGDNGDGILVARRKDRIVVTPVVRQRPRRQVITDTPALDVDHTKLRAWMRAIAAWAGWIAQARFGKKRH